MIRCLHELKAISVFLFKNEFTYNLVNMSHAMADISFLNFLIINSCPLLFFKDEKLLI